MRDGSCRIAMPGGQTVVGDLDIPHDPVGLVVFAHGSGSSRFSPRNRQVAAHLNSRGLATMLMDLLTAEEETRDSITAELRFDIELLGQRVVAVVDWLDLRHDLTALPLACFGASTGAAAALVAAAGRPGRVAAVVSRGGRPDLAGASLARVTAPTLLIVGGLDTAVLELNQRAAAAMTAPVDVHVVAGATHLFEETGTLDEVARVTADWLVDVFSAPTASGGRRNS